MPTNLYGPGDNFNLEKSHVLPALLRKIHLGKCLEDGNWTAIRKDMNRNPVESIKGDSDESIILNILKNYGIHLKKSTLDNKTDNIQSALNKVVVSVWGTGTPMREFMYSQDMAEACVYLMENVNVIDIISLNQTSTLSDYHTLHFLNIGTGEEISIRDLVLKIKKLIGFKGEIVFDESKPDGTMRKATDITLLKKLGFSHKYDLDSGLAKMYSEYLR
jgi:GDP-L-fucose synthase